MADIQESILNQVKKELNIFEELSNHSLLEKLIIARREKHPDKYTDDDAKKIAEEDFKRLGELIQSFQLYLEQVRVNTPSSEIALYDERQQKINKVNEIASLYENLYKLQDKIKSLNSDIERKNIQIKELQESNDELFVKRLDESNLVLNKIYKPQKGTKYISIASICVLMLGNIRVIKEQVIQILSFSESTLNWIFSVILICATLSLVYSYFCNHRLNILFSKFSSLLFISQNLSIHEEINRVSYKKEYFIWETDIEDFIKSEMQRSKIDKLLFAPKQTIIQREIKHYVITELCSKKIIKFGTATNLNRKFIVSSDNEDWLYLA